MARGGSKPGERRGGRKKGVPNKTVLARAAIISERAKAENKPLAVQAMTDGFHRYIALAAPFQKGGPQENIKEFEHFFDKAMDLAKYVAPYESAKLQSTTLIGDRDKPITHTLNVKFV
jgi:hypothetical protein